MSEAIILEAMQKLERIVVETNINIDDKQSLEDVLNELRMVLDFLKDKELGERKKLDYLLADFAEMAQDLADLVGKIRDVTYFCDISNNSHWIGQTRQRVMEFGASRPQSDGEDEGVVVGLEKDTQQLIGKVILNDSLRELLVVCIKGMIGVGKTTLARQVYNHPAIVEKYKHRRAWISLSRDTSIHEVLVELVKQMVELDGYSLLLEEMDNRSLRHVLCWHLELEQKPYFIVLDNMSPKMHLESILDSLPKEDGSWLLVTSCCELTIRRDYYIHEMETLDSDKSWQLFLKTINKFTSDENKFSKEVERKAKEILKKCGGLPMAIIDVARQKAKQRLSGIEWEALFDSVDLSETLKLLEPMYHELDEDMKPCFLHMSFFKENAIMREEKLKQIWNASGLNTRKHSAHHLLSQSVIVAVHPYPQVNYEVKRCRINPLLHMLSIKKAEEEMGFEILSSNGNSRPSPNPRHRVILCGREKLNHSTNEDKDNKHIVSLIFHGGGRYLDEARQSYWRSFEVLKILDMEDFGVKALSESIGNFTELRYLGLRNNYIQEIPNSVRSLEMLEVLDIALNFMVVVSDIICEMGSLRYLYMSDVIYLKPLKVDALQNLITLTHISIYDWTCEVSGLETMALEKLGIEDVDENSDVGKLFASLATIKRLRHLILRGFRFRSMSCLDEIKALYSVSTLRIDGLLSRLPRVNKFHSWIEYLALVNTCLDKDPMPVLGKLRYLKRLKLCNAYTGEKMSVQHLCFPKLQFLCIKEMWNLRGIKVSMTALSNLTHLEIKTCPRLETLPEEIGTMVMRELRKFEMVTTKHIATKIRNSGLTSAILEVDISP